MRKTAKAKFMLGVLCAILTLSTPLAGCSKGDGIYIPHPDFATVYTEEEHVQRITERTEEIYAEEIASGQLVKYNVEILHAFEDDDPEYFLVELEYADECISGKYKNPKTGENEPPYIYYNTKYTHTIGFIISDEYYLGGGGLGRSGYAVCPYPNNKKYCGSGTDVQGVEVNGQIILTATATCIDYPNTGVYENHTHYDNKKCPVGEVIPENLYSAYNHFGQIQAGAPRVVYGKEE